MGFHPFTEVSQTLGLLILDSSAVNRPSGVDAQFGLATGALRDEDQDFPDRVLTLDFSDSFVFNISGVTICPT